MRVRGQCKCLALVVAVTQRSGKCAEAADQDSQGVLLGKLWVSLRHTSTTFMFQPCCCTSHTPPTPPLSAPSPPTPLACVSFCLPPTAPRMAAPAGGGVQAGLGQQQPLPSLLDLCVRAAAAGPYWKVQRRLLEVRAR